MQTSDVNEQSKIEQVLNINTGSNTGNISGLSLILMMGSVLLIFIVALLAFERYFANSSNKPLIRILIIGFGLNIIIMLFIIVSYSKIQFTSGKRGPKGIRGLQGKAGDTMGISGCQAQDNRLGTIKKKEALLKRNEFKRPVILAAK